MSLIGTEFQEVPHFCTDISPLFPVTHPNTASNPLIYTRNRTVILCNSKVVSPPSDILPELHHPIIHGDPPASAGEFTNTPLKFLKRFVGSTDFTPLVGEAKK